MKATRTIASVLTAALLGSLLAGCTPAGPDVSTSSSPDADDVTELTFFAPVDVSASSARFYRTLIDRFNAEHADVRVTLDGVATGDGFNGFLEERLDSGEGDDVFVVNADSVKSLYKKGHFYDMSGFSVFNSLNDAARVQSTIGDIAYCLPIAMNAYSMVVNLDVLERSHLSVPENLDEFMHCCEVIKANGEVPLALNRWYALTVPAMANGLYDVYTAADQQQMIDGLNSGQVRVGDYMERGFELVEQFIDNGWYGDGLTTAEVDAIKAGDRDIPAIAAGEAAFMFGPAQAYEKVLAENAETRLVVTGVPAADGLVTLPAAGVRLSMNAHGKNLETTREFIGYLTSEEMESERTGEAGLLPVFKGQHADLDERLDSMVEVYDTRPQIPIVAMTASAFAEDVREALNAGMDAHVAKSIDLPTLETTVAKLTR